MLEKLLIAAAVMALAPTGTALANESGRYGYGGGGGYYSDHYYGDRYRHHRYDYRRYDNRRLNRFDRELRQLRYAYRHGYISRGEYRARRAQIQRERRWHYRSAYRYRDRHYGYRG